MNELETKTLPDGSRIERVRELVDEILLNMSDPTEGRCAYLHLYGVAQACALLALKCRENVELAVIARYVTRYLYLLSYGLTGHAHKGAQMATSY